MGKEWRTFIKLQAPNEKDFIAQELDPWMKELTKSKSFLKIGEAVERRTDVYIVPLNLPELDRAGYGLKFRNLKYEIDQASQLTKYTSNKIELKIRKKSS